MASEGTSLISAYDYVWQRFTNRLAGLSDDEYFWEPVAGCWSLRQDAEGAWRLDGRGGGGPAPEPVPVTTIAWRIGHAVGLGLAGFADRLFGSGALSVGAIGFPADVEQLPAFLDEHYQAWRAGLATLDKDRWQQPLGPAWGPYAESTTMDVVLHVFDEVVHHGGEVGVLRDLYRHRVELHP